MTDTANDNPVQLMPSAEQIAVETVGRLAAEGYTSSVMKLPRPVLNELGRRLVTPGGKRKELLAWLAEEAAKAGEPAIADRNVDRFAQRFREVFKIVWGEWANKLILTNLATDPAFDVDQLQSLIKNRVATLIAQEVMTSSPAELETDRIQTALSFVIAADKGKLDREKLLLQQAQTEHRALKAEADVQRIRQDIRLRDLRVAEQVKSLLRRIEELSKRASRGEAVEPAVLDRIRDELLGIAPAPAPGREAA